MKTRYFVNLLGKGGVEETLDHLEEHHGYILNDEEGRMRAKLLVSNCGNFIHGTVEISPRGAE